MIPESEVFNLKDIKIKKQLNKPKLSNIKKDIIGLDTETNINTGNIFLICDNIGNYLDLRHNNNINILINWLFRYTNKWCFTYNLSFDATVMLKLLPRIDIFSDKYEITLNDRYKIKYINKKCLKITDILGKRSVHLYDLAQYYKISLDKASNKYLNKEKYEINKDMFTDNHINGVFFDNILHYCKLDALLCKELGDLWVDLFYNTVKIYPKHYYSTGYLAEQVLLSTNNTFNRFNDIPYAVQDMAWKCYFGGRFEIGERGTFKELYEFDLNSAYPWSMTLLPDFTQGNWIRNIDNSKDISRYGFYKVKINSNKYPRYSPFPFRYKDTIYYPNGQYITYITGFELYILSKEDIDIEILDGYTWINSKINSDNIDKYIDNIDNRSINIDNIYPLKQEIEDKYAWRLQLQKDNDEKEQVVKIILNSIYGKFAQRVSNISGNIFNPVYASLITGITRAKLYKDVINDLDNIVSFATDSVLSTKPLDLDIGEGLGQWRFNGKSDGWIMASGIYKVNNKVKSRGFGKIYIEKEDKFGTFNPYDNEYYIDNEGRVKYKIKYLKLHNIKESVIRDKITDIGKLTIEPKELDLNCDIKRYWFNDLTSIYDHNTSIPLPIDLITE